jgi:hypothetical protein
MVNEVRSELFSFPEVLDVFITGRLDALVVVCSGRPRPGEWLGALRRAGYDVPAKQHTTAVAFDADRTNVVAPPHSPTSSPPTLGRRAPGRCRTPSPREHVVAGTAGRRLLTPIEITGAWYGSLWALFNIADDLLRDVGSCADAELL